MSDNNASPFSPDSIVATLAELPGKVLQSDMEIAKCEAVLDDLNENLELAEVNASLNAQTDGKDAATRELQRKKAVGTDGDVQQYKVRVGALKVNLEEARAQNKMLTRQFAAYCHIAELKAAQLNLMSKGVTK